MDKPSAIQATPGDATVGIGCLRYRAFISYSHRDSAIARWLHRSLEGYRVPSRLRGTAGEFGPLPDRLIPIFRDREDLSSAGELGPRIQTALQDSEALIVICSPDAARSPWANDEVLAFKRLGRGERIYCLIVDGEPGSADAECFPPALRFDLDEHGQIGTHPAEPLAADIRAGKDGKSLARLKILSGLLGVPLDTLRQREAARRQRRLLAITALSLLVMLVTSVLAVQAMIARHAAELARHAAEISRNDAQRRQKQAEDLVDFMLGNLTDKLSQVSRLDIMEAVDDQAMKYFQSLPATDVSDKALELRATALEKIGSVRLDQGHLPQALESYQAAAALAGKLAKATPDNIERQLAWANELAYVGTARWYQGDLAQAQQSFLTSQAVLLRAKAHSDTMAKPVLQKLLFQLSTLDNNIGHVLESRGQLDAAAMQYLSMLQLVQALVSMRPDNYEWAIQLGSAHNNLAKMALMRGDLATAVAEYRADVAIETGLSGKDPKNNQQSSNVVRTSAALGRTLALTGDIDGGIANLRHALDLVIRLRAVDASSTAFEELYALYSTQLAHLLRVNGDHVGAASLANQAIASLERLAQQDPGNSGWQSELAEARIELGQQALAANQPGVAQALARSALSIMELQLAKQADDRSIVLDTVRARLLLAAVTTDAGMASKLREQALKTVQAQTAGRADPRLRALQVEALFGLGRRADAEPLWQALWRDGFHDPGFVALLRVQGITPPPSILSSNAAAPPTAPHRP